MKIQFTYGSHQRFRYRCEAVHIRGRVEDARFPLNKASFRVNDGLEQSFYVESTADENVDWVRGYKSSPAELRCRDLGDFCLEIPCSSLDLIPGNNVIRVEVEDLHGTKAQESIVIVWNPAPLPVDLDLSDLTIYRNIQDVGQVANGAFDLDFDRNVIRSRGPVAPDSLLIIGSPYGSQEASYGVRFLDFTGVKWLGLSDFFVRFEEGEPPRGIKVGWSSAGMATLNPRGEARSFIAWGDHSGSANEWVVVTNPPTAFPVQRQTLYRVRHQVVFDGGVNRVRFRVWNAKHDEPTNWLCEESDQAIEPDLPRFALASFGLFQHSGMPIEWSDIRVCAI